MATVMAEGKGMVVALSIGSFRVHGHHVFAEIRNRARSFEMVDGRLSVNIHSTLFAFACLAHHGASYHQSGRRMYCYTTNT